MKTEAVIERLDACIYFMEEVKQFVLSSTMHGVEMEPVLTSIPEIAKKQQEEKQAENAAETEDLYADLIDMTEEELEGILEAYELKLPRKVKTRDHKVALMDAVIKGIKDGVIQVEEDGDADSEDGDGQETSEAGEEESTEANDEDSQESDSDGDDEDSTSAELSELQVALKEAIESGDIKMSEVKRFLSANFADDEECAECKGCSKDDTIDCYLVAMEKALTDDEGEIHVFEEPYLKNEEVFCCGLPCNEKKGRYFCQGHCKQDFELE